MRVSDDSVQYPDCAVVDQVPARGGLSKPAGQRLGWPEMTLWATDSELMAMQNFLLSVADGTGLVRSLPAT